MNETARILLSSFALAAVSLGAAVGLAIGAEAVLDSYGPGANYSAEYKNDVQPVNYSVSPAGNAYAVAPRSPAP